MMQLTDNEIEKLISESKTWPGRHKITFKREAGHKRAGKELETRSDNRFNVFIRQNARDPLDFSVGLVYMDRTTGEKIHLLGCNGPSHRHPNKIEGNDVDFTFHVHQATERYIIAGKEAEGWASGTDEYKDLDSALAYFAKRANIQPVPYIKKAPPEKPSLFE